MKRTYFPGITDIVVVTDPVKRGRTPAQDCRSHSERRSPCNRDTRPHRRTAPSPCYPAMFEPSLNVFVQGRKRITFAGMT